MGLRDIYKPIIEGKIRDFIHQHPDILNGITWRHSGDKETALVNSLCKRILGDLLSDPVVERVKAALSEKNTDDPAT